MLSLLEAVGNGGWQAREGRGAKAGLEPLARLAWRRLADEHGLGCCLPGKRVGRELVGRDVL